MMKDLKFSILLLRGAIQRRNLAAGGGVTAPGPKGFAAMSFALSTFLGGRTAVYVAGAAMVVVMSVMNVVPIPYMTHRGRRAMQWYVKAVVIPFFLSAPILFVVARRYTFDVFLIGMLWFTVLGWFPVHPDERREFYVEYRRWTAELAR